MRNNIKGTVDVDGACVAADKVDAVRCRMLVDELNLKINVAVVVVQYLKTYKQVETEGERERVGGTGKCKYEMNNANWQVKYLPIVLQPFVHPLTHLTMARSNGRTFCSFFWLLEFL